MSKISARLGEWYNEHKRDLPWRATKDPYQVWLSEIILQQTQIKQGLPYFLRFIEAYPTVHHLAAASEVDILNLWQGLGYYSRAINLHKCARQISRDFQGIFPQNSVELKQLVGIGDYTAAAIASIAFSEAIAAVDGNVYRVLSRLFDIDTPINTTAGHRLFRELAEEQLDPRSPGDHNQALMEFGALVCTPKNPHCATCIFREECLALKTMTVAQRPVKLKKSKVLERWHFYFVFRAQDHLLIQKRHDHSIWKNMYDFPNVEGDSFKTLSDLVMSSAIGRYMPIFMCLIGPISLMSIALALSGHRKTSSRIILGHD
jgi:A/G-specific adenine glycosylase